MYVYTLDLNTLQVISPAISELSWFESSYYLLVCHLVLENRIRRPLGSPDSYYRIRPAIGFLLSPKTRIVWLSRETVLYMTWRNILQPHWYRHNPNSLQLI